jgi:flagellar biosynthesis protein FlhG
VDAEEPRVAAEVPLVDELLAPLEEEAEPAARPREPVLPALDGFADVDDEEGGSYDGPRLRRARLLRGVEIEQIADVTKVNPTYLHFIEEERFNELPATVYVRGFVSAYARCLGLEPSGVSLSYVERIQQHRGEGENRKSRSR